MTAGSIGITAVILPLVLFAEIAQAQDDKLPNGAIMGRDHPDYHDAIRPALDAFTETFPSVRFMGSVAQTRADYDAAIEAATRRYRGDILPQREIDSRKILRVEETVYDAAIRDAIRRYRGDILPRRETYLPRRETYPREIPKVGEVRHFEASKLNDAFAPKPFTLQSTSPNQ